ncbi:MAG TPA: low temperature requirement protein A [Acidimicrobiia bacterium]|nr:low temperature requirement protein A [Acidimicrobiia bacterium]
MATSSPLRRLWQPPRRYADRDPDRRVSFLELFFDLVFVAVISQLAHALSEDPSWSGVGWFLFIFYAIWSSWINGTLYHDLHGINDLSTRVLTFAQMLAVAVMAVHVGEIPGGGVDGFAIGYAANTLLLVVLWFRTGLHDPSHRPASIPYSAAYLASAVLFATSVLAEPPLIYWMWAMALVCQITGFVVAMNRWTPPESQAGDAVIATTPSLIERMGLFVIIVLGEVVVGSVNGMSKITPLNTDELVIGLLGMLVAVGLWWLYFDLVSHRAPVSRLTQVWFNLHLPLVMAVAASGAAVQNGVTHAGEPLAGGVRWLLVGSVATATVTVTALTLTLETRRKYEQVYLVAERSMLIAAAIALLVGLTGWDAKGSLLAMVVLLLGTVYTALRVWAGLMPQPE